MTTINYGSCAVKPYFFDVESTTCLRVCDNSTALSLNNEFDEDSFMSYFTTPAEQFTLQLQNASLADCLERYQSYRRTTSPNYTNYSVIAAIRSIESRMSGRAIMPELVTEIFYAKMQVLLIDKRGLKGSTVENYFHQISAALNWAKQYGAKISPGYNKFKVEEYSGARYALSIEEVCKIYEFDVRKLTRDVVKPVKKKITMMVERHRTLKDGTVKRWYEEKERYVEVDAVVTVPRFREEHMQKLERVRDMFVLCCMLMQRYSDMVRITPESFNKQRTQFTTVQKKTGRRAFVNLHNLTMSEGITCEILEKYGYYAPYTGTTNNFNAALHELLDLIGGRFHETIRVENKVRGQIVTEDIRLCDAITSHCGRRSGITSAICSGINAPRVMRASGHADYRTFEGYIRRCVDDVNE